MDAYLAPLAGVTLIRSVGHKVDYSARAEDTFYVRYDADARFYEVIGGVFGAVSGSVDGIATLLRNAAGALASSRRLAPRN